MEGMGEEAQALAVRYIQKPQDGHADTAAKLSFSPSYVTYNPVTIQNIQGFFDTGEVRISFAQHSSCRDMTHLGLKCYKANIYTVRQGCWIPLSLMH